MITPLGGRGASAGQRRVLVVDDDEVTLEVLRTILDLEEFVVVTAGNGDEALERVLEDPPDAVVLDVMMPGLDGWGVLEHLEDPLPAIIVVSGLATDRDRHYRHAIEKGALGFVSKPFDSAKLLELIATAVELDADQRTAFRRWLLDGAEGGPDRYGSRSADDGTGSR